MEHCIKRTWQVCASFENAMASSLFSSMKLMLYMNPYYFIALNSEVCKVQVMSPPVCMYTQMILSSMVYVNEWTISSFIHQVSVQFFVCPGVHASRYIIVIYMYSLHAWTGHDMH